MIKPSASNPSLTTLTVFSNGVPIDPSFMVISVYVYKAVNHIGSAKLVLAMDNLNISNADEMQSDVFIPGREIRIDAGYGNHKTIYEGVLTSHNLQISQDTRATLHIECQDYIFPATLGRKNSVFSEMKDSDMIRQILDQYPMLNVTVSSTSVHHESLVQYYCSDWDFLLSRAEANGLVVISDGKSVQVVKPDVTSASAITLSYGSNIIAFNGTLDSTTQTTAVEAMAWDAAAQQIVKIPGDMPVVNNQGNITPAKLAETYQQNTLLQTTTATEQVLKSWADAQWFKSALGRYKGTITFQGVLVAPGSMIELKGLGARFDGDAYIGTVVHEIAEGNWQTTATMGISASNHVGETQESAVPASGLLPGTQGLQVGKVANIENDPAGEGRIQVEIPLLHNSLKIIWARLATFWAGDASGAFFMPDIGDEVVLGFFNEDPCHAVVLGSLYSSNRKANQQLTNENYVKSLSSRTGIKIVFDDEKKNLTFSSSGNKIVLSDSGISIESADKLVLSAGSGIEINAGTTLAIEGKSGITMKGANIEASADITFTAKGNASAELSAAGQVTVKGAMVSIN